MLLIKEIILCAELEDGDGSLEQLRIEVFIINQKIQKVSRLKLFKDVVFLSKCAKVQNLLELVETSKSPLEISIDNEVDYEL